MRTQMIVLISLAALILFPGRGLTQSRAPSPTSASGTPTPAPAALANTRLQALLAEGQFRRSDRNRDGLLSNDEMPEELRSEREKWDTNRDGFIDLEEYRAYFLARGGQQRADSQALRVARPSPPRLESRDQVPRSESEDDNRRPVVYRLGKLPDGLPSWFVQLDTDRDGQIGLYEWKKSSRPLEEFLRMDRNNDGFLTAQEVLRYLASPQAQSRTSPMAVNSRFPYPTPSPPERAGTGTGPGRERKP